VKNGIDGPPPYRMALVVWQGDVNDGGAAWVGIIERQAGKIHPRARNIANPDAGKAPIVVQENMSRFFDAEDLTIAFIRDIDGK
jgi:hypothetical protein